MRLRTYRVTSQVVFTVLTLGGLFGITTTGLIYPYFFCYSCPWDVGACPIGILEHGFVDLQNAALSISVGITLLLYLFGFLFLIGIIFGRAFCGWACPVGVLQDITKKLGIGKRVQKKTGPREINPKTKYIKYLILASIPVTSYATASLFYTTFCPVGGITGTVPTLAFYYNDWLLGSTFLLKITSVFLFILLILLVIRGWCKYLCPVGALLAPWNKISAIGVTRIEEKCIDCGLCDKSCPMDIKDIGKKSDMECILCGRCVDSCRKDSLKLGLRITKAKIMGIIPVIIVIALGTSMLVAGAWGGGYERTDAINDIPCLGCLALDPVSPEGWFSVDESLVELGLEELPEFILEPLATGPVLIDYRTTACAACDEMDPHVHALEEDYDGQALFFYIVLDGQDVTEEEFDSYDIFDVLGTPDERAGVPMFPIISYYQDENGTVGIYFNVLYGSSSDGGLSKKADIAEVLDEAVITYSQFAPHVSEQMPFVELFVAIDCVNCPKAEEALLILMEDEELCTFISYVCDAPGASGLTAIEREIYLSTTYGVGIGRPWAIFGGGPVLRVGAPSLAEITQSYRTDINSTYLDPLNASVSGVIADNGNSMFVNVTMNNYENTTESLRLQVFILEVTSRWLNSNTHEPIPYAVVDILANDTYPVAGGSSQTISDTWSGTDVTYSDMRLSNIAVVAVVWHGDNLVTSTLIESGVPEVLWMTMDEPVKAALPDGSASFGMVVENYQDQAMTVNFSARSIPANWSVSFSPPILTIPANSSATFDAIVTGSGTTVGDTANFTIRAQDINDATLFIDTHTSVEVKSEIAAPEILQPEYSPPEPRANEEVTVSVVVGDYSDIQSVQIEYYTCNDAACSISETINMTFQEDEGAYLPDHNLMPKGLDHNILHYRIIAEDVHANVNVTDWYDVPLIPVVSAGDGGGTSPFNTYGIGLILIFAMVAIGLNVARMRKAPTKPKKPVESTPLEDEDERAETLSPAEEIDDEERVETLSHAEEIDDDEELTQIAEPLDESGITEEQN